MGYLFLLLAISAALVKGFCGKRMSGCTEETVELAIISLVRMFFCVIIGFFVVFITQGAAMAFAINGTGLLIATLSGIATATFLLTWLLAVKNGAYMLLEVFLTLGVLVPLLLCAFLFNEEIIWIKWIGIALLVVAAYFMCSYNNSVKKTKITSKGFALLLICCISNGLVQFSQKWFVFETLNGNVFCDASTFNFYTYIVSFVLLGAFVLCMRFGQRKKNLAEKQSTAALLKSVWYYVVIMAVCLFMYSYFTTLAATYLSSSELYPLQQGLSLVGSMAMAAVFFKEKITKKCVWSIVITFIALIIINVLPAMI